MVIGCIVSFPYDNEKISLINGIKVLHIIIYVHN